MFTPPLVMVTRTISLPAGIVARADSGICAKFIGWTENCTFVPLDWLEMLRSAALSRFTVAWGSIISNGRFASAKRPSALLESIAVLADVWPERSKRATPFALLMIWLIVAVGVSIVTLPPL